MWAFKCEARERTQTYVTEAETRKKGARRALICLLVEHTQPKTNRWKFNMYNYLAKTTLGRQLKGAPPPKKFGAGLGLPCKLTRGRDKADKC